MVVVFVPPSPAMATTTAPPAPPNAAAASATGAALRRFMSRSLRTRAFWNLSRTSKLLKERQCHNEPGLADRTLRRQRRTREVWEHEKDCRRGHSGRRGGRAGLAAGRGGDAAGPTAGGQRLPADDGLADSADAGAVRLGRPPLLQPGRHPLGLR